MIAATHWGRERRRRARIAGAAAPLAAALVAAGVLLAGCGAPTTAAPQPPASTPTPTPTAAPTPAVDVPVVSSTLAPVAAPVAPSRLRLDAIGVDMPVEPVGVDGTQMALPVDPAVAGWYRFGPDAPSTSGHIVLSAHVDAPQYPIGPLARLREVAPGAAVSLTDETGQARSYIVESVTYYPKTDLPVDDIFAREGAPAVVIITCGGPFDAATGRYRDNVVAVARPA
ncbi:class F sortase [Microbacterium hominis]|uniref:Class F sortase n=1 Tax=Microbacterium hominis TaxID=162426 RepID=A0A7D4U604_9MICO|nr:class F sortase [Microbacterium hominis]QKJ20565.1 class F sortase [Microbacterium hominis]